MTRPLRIGREARVELLAAARWYETRQIGLGLDFVRMADRALTRIDLDPGIGSPVPGVDDPTIRRVPVRRFPFHIVDIEMPDRLQVLAVAHQRWRPGYWWNRFPD